MGSWGLGRGFSTSLGLFVWGFLFKGFIEFILKSNDVDLIVIIYFIYCSFFI